MRGLLATDHISQPDLSVDMDVYYKIVQFWPIASTFTLRLFWNYDLKIFSEREELAKNHYGKCCNCNLYKDLLFISKCKYKLWFATLLIWISSSTKKRNAAVLRSYTFIVYFQDKILCASTITYYSPMKKGYGFLRVFIDYISTKLYSEQSPSL